MTNLDSIFKSRDVTLLTKVRLVKAMVFPVVMYGCESWTGSAQGEVWSTVRGAGLPGWSVLVQNAVLFLFCLSVSCTQMSLSDADLLWDDLCPTGEQHRQVVSSSPATGPNVCPRVWDEGDLSSVYKCKGFSCNFWKHYLPAHKRIEKILKHIQK